MNAPLPAAVQQAQALAGQVAEACDRIAPVWPLDQLIAVNPYWGWREQPIAEAAAWLGRLSGTRLSLPREHLQALWQQGRLRREHLAAAAALAGSDLDADRLEAALQRKAASPQPLPLVTTLREAAPGPRPAAGWTAQVLHQISQHCAACFDEGQAAWHAPHDGLLAGWKQALAGDRGLPWRRGRRWLRARLQALPDDPMALIGELLAALGLPEAGRTAYLGGLLHSVQGWAAWCAGRRWRARQAGGDDHTLVELLAVRLAWDWLLHDDAPSRSLTPGWPRLWADAAVAVQALAREQRADWLLQHAAELAYQQPLAAALAARGATARPAPMAPAVQAVFCIDVRSEVLRRALEAADPGIATRGFAGFFGLPVAYRPAGSDLVRPQLPGLLAPAAEVSEAEGSGALGQWLARRRRAALEAARRWDAMRSAPASVFTTVEACGLFAGVKLLADSLPAQAAPGRWEDAGLPAEGRGLRPRWQVPDAGLPALAERLHGVLRAMGLTQQFAPLVLLAGHGSRNANNAQAAALDCGACGGQTGEVNARVLAELLNRPAVRDALAQRGAAIPPGTHFVAGLHDTTTDEVRLFDLDDLPPALQPALQRLQDALAEAGRRARAERAPALGLEGLADAPETLAATLRRRGNDWAEQRPEWGLAGNAAFIVAPRARSLGLDLGGRSFLHDYDWREDGDGSVLTLIMTAPMVVTNWINLQYHASTVDNARYGSGNKLLHNVVGGRLGVFEGNGGDLRIGLPLQSLHDGRQWRHEPLRLSVFIEAPRAAIDAVIAAHDTVRHLVDHGWLHLLRIAPEDGHVEQRWQGRWQALPQDATEAC